MNKQKKVLITLISCSMLLFLFANLRFAYVAKEIHKLSAEVNNFAVIMLEDYIAIFSENESFTEEKYRENLELIRKVSTNKKSDNDYSMISSLRYLNRIYKEIYLEEHTKNEFSSLEETRIIIINKINDLLDEK